MKIMKDIPVVANGNSKPKAITSATTSTIDFDFTYFVTAGINPLNLKLGIFII